MYNQTSWWGLMLLVLYSCTPTDAPPQIVATRAHYFPIENLFDGVVYEYSIAEQDQSYRSHYWHLQSTIENGDTFLIWKRYNPLFENDQYIKEWIIRDGVITQEYYFYAYDSTEQAFRPYVNEVEQNVVFPFHAVTDSNSVYRFTSTVTLPPSFVKVKLIRDRRFAGQQDVNYQGQSYSTIVFESEDYYDLDGQEEGGFWEQRQQLKEIYAEGIGLIEEERTGPDGQPRKTYLSNRYTSAEFEQLQATAQEQH